MTRPVVLHVCAAEYSARTLLVPQLDFLNANGFETRLACAPDAGTIQADLGRFDPVAVHFSRQVDPIGALRSGRQLAAVVREIQPELVHLHSSSAAFAARIMPRSAFGSPAFPIVFTVHGFPFHWSDLSHPRDRVLEWSERWLARRTDLMLFQSREDLAESERRGYRSRLRYLGNGVQERWFADFPPVGTGGRLRVVFVGRLIRAKGVLDLLAAACRVPSVEVVIAGGRLRSERDDIVAELDALAADPRLNGRVELLGSVAPADMPEVIAGADVFALPSSHPEGVPRSIIEAMAAGRPVITTNIRGCRELIDEEVEGWLVPAQNIDALTAALERIVSMPRDRLREVGAAGRRRAIANHREADALSRLQAAYAEVGVRAAADV